MARGTKTYISRFFKEKDIDPEETFTVEGPSGPNFMPYGVVIEAIKTAPLAE